MNRSLGLLLTLLPAVMLGGGALICTVVALVRPRIRTSIHRWITLEAAAGAFVASLLELAAMTHNRSGVGAITNEGGIVADRFHVFGSVLVQAILVLTALASGAYARRFPARAGAFFALLQLSSAAATMLLAQQEMAAFTAAFALLLTCLTLLTAMTKTSSLTAEAGFRQVLSGGAGLATSIYGLVLLYAATGATDLSRVRTGFRTDGTRVDAALAVVGIALVVIGLLVAIGGPPLQAWMRHVHEAAPGPIAGFSSTLGVVTATAVLARFAVDGFGSGSSHWTVLVQALAAIAMLTGGVLAVRADSIRRLIADLTMAQAGFLLLAISATGRGFSGVALAGPTALLFALMGTAAALLASLFLAGIFDGAGLGTGLDAYRGVGRRAPATAAFLTLALLGLAGAPPLSSFVGRLLITESVVDGGAAWAAAVAGLATVLTLVSLVRWVAAMYADDNNEAPFAVTTTPTLSRVAAWGAALLTLLLAAFAGPLISLAGGGATALH